MERVTSLTVVSRRVRVRDKELERASTDNFLKIDIHTHTHTQ